MSNWKDQLRTSQNSILRTRDTTESWRIVKFDSPVILLLANDECAIIRGQLNNGEGNALSSAGAVPTYFCMRPYAGGRNHSVSINTHTHTHAEVKGNIMTHTMPLINIKFPLLWSSNDASAFHFECYSLICIVRRYNNNLHQVVLLEEVPWWFGLFRRTCYWRGKNYIYWGSWTQQLCKVRLNHQTSCAYCASTER